AGERRRPDRAHVARTPHAHHHRVEPAALEADSRAARRTAALPPRPPLPAAPPAAARAHRGVRRTLSVTTGWRHGRPGDRARRVGEHAGARVGWPALRPRAPPARHAREPSPRRAARAGG